MSEENKQVVISCWEAVNQHDATAFDRHYAPDVVYYGTDGEIRGRENVKAYLLRYMTAMPDIKLTVEDVFGEADRVFSRVRMQGTNTGPFGDVPATGKAVDLQWIMNAARVVNGRIVEEWEICDQMDVMRQLGLVPAET